MDAKSLQTFLEGKGHIRLVPYAGWSLVNLHAIRRAIDSSPDLFATARAVSRSDAELYRWLKSGGLSKFNDTEYGLVSGFPRDAVSFFSIEGAGISRIIESYQGMERELVDVICYMGNDKDPDMRAKFLATLRKALTEKRIDAEHFQAIVRRHDVSSRILGGFVGYDRGDQEWATQQDTRFFEIFREFDSMQRPPDVRAQNPQGNTQHTQPIPGEKREPPISEMRSHTARWLDSFFLHIRNFSAHLENAFRNNALLLASA